MKNIDPLLTNISSFDSVIFELKSKMPNIAKHNDSQVTNEHKIIHYS